MTAADDGDNDSNNRSLTSKALAPLAGVAKCSSSGRPTAKGFNVGDDENADHTEPIAACADNDDKADGAGVGERSKFISADDNDNDNSNGNK